MNNTPPVIDAEATCTPLKRQTMIKKAIGTKDPAVKSYQWAEGCLAWVLQQTPGTTIKEELMAPGTRERLHLHQYSEQFFYVLEGSALFYIEGQPIALDLHQGLQVAPGSAHFITNPSDDTPLRFLVITTPGENPNAGSDRVDL